MSTANARTFGYDDLGRLTSASGPWGAGAYVYDALGNLRSKTLGSRTVTNTYDANNLITSSADSVNGTRALTYNGRGNVRDLGGLHFVWDKHNQITVVSGDATATYRYDGNNKRVVSVTNGKTLYNVFNAAGQLTHIEENPGTPESEVIDYIHGAGQTIARMKYANSTDTVTYLHPDHLGSALSGSDADGMVAWREQYTPFGETISDIMSNDNRDGFTGHIKDSATGLTYMQARFYDPGFGRFLSVDPVGFSPNSPGSFNRYTYGLNDPINLIDPDGKQARPPMRRPRFRGDNMGPLLEHAKPIGPLRQVNQASDLHKLEHL